jgi:endonuclease G
MTNIVPQAPANNRGVWADLESYSRDLAREGKTLYIVAGGEGELLRIANHKIVVPANTWKVIVVLDSPDAFITRDTRVIAVLIPNNQLVANTNWQDYRVSVKKIETLTGLDLLSSVKSDIQVELEYKVDNK